MKFKSFLKALFFFYCSSAISAEPLTVRYSQVEPKYEYIISLLNLALKETILSDGPFILEPILLSVTKSRQIKIFSDDGFDVMWMPTTKEREESFLAINIPLLKGILGYRVFMIRKERAQEFAKVNNLFDLKSKFVAGFGNQWADLEILEQNGIRVQGVPQYELLYPMLSVNRFDFFPRGLDEAWIEIEEISETHPNIVIEDSLALYYPYPYYFFVSRSDQKLAERIRRGLKAIERNGVFKDLFMKYHHNFVELAELGGRKLIKLKNHKLPEDSLVPDTSWWLTDK